MADFKKALEHVLGLEGGYVDDKNDSGGKTNYGITKNLAVAHGYTGDMKHIPFEKVCDIYRVGFWDKLKLDRITSQTLATRIFDIAVNCGYYRACVITQKSYNSMWNTKSKIAEDGIIGSRTIARLNSVSKSKGSQIRLLVNMSGFLVAHYIKLVRARDKDRKFLYGWLIKRGHIALDHIE